MDLMYRTKLVQLSAQGCENDLTRYMNDTLYCIYTTMDDSFLSHRVIQTMARHEIRFNDKTEVRNK